MENFQVRKENHVVPELIHEENDAIFDLQNFEMNVLTNINDIPLLN